MTDLTGNSGTITDIVKDLNLSWEDSGGNWNDDFRRDFENYHWQQIEENLRHTSVQIATLSQDAMNCIARLEHQMEQVSQIENRLRENERFSTDC